MRISILFSLARYSYENDRVKSILSLSSPSVLGEIQTCSSSQVPRKSGPMTEPGATPNLVAHPLGFPSRKELEG